MRKDEFNFRLRVAIPPYYTFTTYNMVDEYLRLVSNSSSGQKHADGIDRLSRMNSGLNYTKIFVATSFCLAIFQLLHHYLLYVVKVTQRRK